VHPIDDALPGSTDSVNAVHTPIPTPAHVAAHALHVIAIAPPFTHVPLPVSSPTKHVIVGALPFPIVSRADEQLPAPETEHVTWHPLQTSAIAVGGVRVVLPISSPGLQEMLGATPVDTSSLAALHNPAPSPMHVTAHALHASAIVPPPLQVLLPVFTPVVHVIAGSAPSPIVSFALLQTPAPDSVHVTAHAVHVRLRPVRAEQAALPANVPGAHEIVGFSPLPTISVALLH
jgi:hypothetical protein